MTLNLITKKRKTVMVESDIIEVRMRAFIRGKWREGWYEAPLASPDRAEKIKLDDGTVVKSKNLPKRIKKYSSQKKKH